jgi:hypothetical protein
LVYCKVWLVFGPGKSLFSHIQWSNKLVSFEPLKITLLHFLYKYYLASFSLINADITAAIGLCLEKLTKKELETTKDVLNSILQGVSCEFTLVH